MRAAPYLMSLLLASAALAAPYDPAAVGWARLEFEATKFFITARSEVALAGRPASEAVAELLDPGGERRALAPRGAKSFRLDLRTRFLSRDSQVRLWLDPGDARALQRSSYEVSKKRLRHRTCRYLDDAVFCRNLTPGEGEEDLPYASWSRVDDEVQVLQANGQVVTEPAALLYLIPAGDFRAPGDKQRLLILTHGQVREVEVEVAVPERIEVDYVEVAGGRERAVAGEVEALRVAVRPLGGAGEDAAEFKLLGLEGDIDIYLEPRTRALLLVRGRIDIVGTVNLRLKRAVMR
jgi:hypothetical protein